MTEYVPPLPPEDRATHSSEPGPNPAAEGTFLGSPVPPERPPFSRMAIWGFVLSCVSIIVFGFVGALGVGLSGRGFRAAQRGIVRGRGLAIAGMIIGTVGFLFYAVSFIVRTL